jgi:hypothetical protein
VEKVVISLEEGKTHKKVGVLLYCYEGEEELRNVIGLIEDSLGKNFPSAEIIRRRAPRELFGERE